MARLTGDQIAEKHARRTIAAVPDYVAGVERVTENPMEKAAAKKDKWAAGIQKAIEGDKFAKGLARVPFDVWKRKTKEKGSARIAAGVNESKEKTADFHREFGSHLDQLESKLSAMPDTTLEDNLARMVTAARHNAGFERKS